MSTHPGRRANGTYLPGIVPANAFKPGHTMRRTMPPEDRLPRFDAMTYTYRILLRKGMEAVIDAADLPKVVGRVWYWTRQGGVVSLIGRSGSVALRRVIMGVSDPRQEIVFVNDDRLDHRRCNLMLGDRVGIGGRSRKRRTNHGRPCTSRFKGVSRSRSGRWQVHIRIDGKSRYLGLFNDEVEAARAYDRAAAKHFKEFARLNFPEQATQA